MRAVLEAATGDPLVALLALLAVAAAASHLLFRHHPLGRAAVRIALLILLTFVLLRANIVPYQPLQSAGEPIQDVVHAVLKIAWWLWAAWFLVGILHAFLIVERSPHGGRLVQDLLAGAVYLAALFAIVGYVFDVSIQGMLVTSGVMAIILGLALQSTLGDVFSGIVLTMSRPYRPGDWINIDGGLDGRVIGMNWRATHVLTGRRDLAILPNSSITKAKIVNASLPARVHGIAITVEIESSTPPSAVVEMLQRATLNCRSMVTPPAPIIAVKAIRRTCTEYEVTFFVADLADSTRAQNELFDLAYRHLAATGIELAQPMDRHWQSAGSLLERARTEPERTLALVGAFQLLTAAERSGLASKLRPHFHEQGDTVLARGMVSQSLFIVASGVLSVTLGAAEGGVEISRLGPGGHFGEIGALAGVAIPFGITALTPAIIYELSTSELEPILEARPDVLWGLNSAQVRGQDVVTKGNIKHSELPVPTNRFESWLARRYTGIQA